MELIIRCSIELIPSNPSSIIIKLNSIPEGQIIVSIYSDNRRINIEIYDQLDNCLVDRLVSSLCRYIIPAAARGIDSPRLRWTVLPRVFGRLVPEVLTWQNIMTSSCRNTSNKPPHHKTRVHAVTSQNCVITNWHHWMAVCIAMHLFNRGLHHSK